MQILRILLKKFCEFPPEHLRFTELKSLTLNTYYVAILTNVWYPRAGRDFQPGCRHQIDLLYFLFKIKSI